MTLDLLFKKDDDTQFLTQSNYFGVAINLKNKKNKSYNDIEHFFLSATYNLTSSRLSEGFLCWLKRYGHLLSPSKIRRLIVADIKHEASILGAFVYFLIDTCKNGHQFKILLPYAKKLKNKKLLYPGPKPRNLNPYFLKYNILTYNYELDENKFLRPISYVYKNCVELKNRALFGSTVNADVASYLSYIPEATPYMIAKQTFHHKASVFKVYYDVSQAN